MVNNSNTSVLSPQNILFMSPISCDQVTQIELLFLDSHLLLSSKHLLLLSLASDRVSLHIQLPSIYMEVATQCFLQRFANMKLHTLGCSKLEFLHGSLGIDELVEQVGLEIIRFVHYKNKLYCITDHQFDKNLVVIIYPCLRYNNVP